MVVSATGVEDPTIRHRHVLPIKDEEEMVFRISDPADVRLKFDIVSVLDSTVIYGRAAVLEVPEEVCWWRLSKRTAVSLSCPLYHIFSLTAHGTPGSPSPL